MIRHLGFPLGLKKGYVIFSNNFLMLSTLQLSTMSGDKMRFKPKKFDEAFKKILKAMLMCKRVAFFPSWRVWVEVMMRLCPKNLFLPKMSVDSLCRVFP